MTRFTYWTTMKHSFLALENRAPHALPKKSLRAHVFQADKVRSMSVFDESEMIVTHHFVLLYVYMGVHLH